MKKKESNNALFSLFYSGIQLLRSIKYAAIWLNSKRSRSHRLNDLLLLAIVLYSSSVYPCVSCNDQVQSGISHSLDITQYLLFTAFVALSIVIYLLAYLCLSSYRTKIGQYYLNKMPDMPLCFAAMVLGISLGGFIDGILMHQILQWHEMVSNIIPPTTLVNKNVNMFWDGIFHLFTLLSTLLGTYLMWRILARRESNKSGYQVTGGMVFGWGIFNLIEGIINHHILQLHNVRELSPDKNLWNYGFLILGILLLLLGSLVIKKGISSTASF